MDLGLSGCRALVTGATQGIGRAIALQLLVEGARVVVCSRNEARVTETVENLGRSAPGRLFGMRANVAQASDLENLVSYSRDVLGGLDVVVINAGHAVGPTGSALSVSDADWKADYEQMFLSGARLGPLTVPAMAARGWGRVVVISTVLAREPNAVQIQSGTLRAAVHAYVKSLSREFGPCGVTCNAVLPGLIETDRLLQSSEYPKGGSRELAASFGVPAGRIGRPEEVASAVDFLCSPVAGYINGAFLAVDGGLNHSL